MIDTNEACPRCGGPLRRFRGDDGALSRSDDETRVCGPCGADEAGVWIGLPASRPVVEQWVRERRELATRRHRGGKDRDREA